MTEAGWDTDAETVAANLESALNMAFDINSPSERVKPVGDNVAAGVGAGMSAHEFLYGCFYSRFRYRNRNIHCFPGSNAGFLWHDRSARHR